MSEADTTGSVNYRIRLARVSDVFALAKLRYALRSKIGKVTEPEAEFLARCTEWMAARLKTGSLWQCWVAESDQELVGCLWLQLVEKIPNPRSEPEYHAYLTNFYVQDSARGKGIGSQMLSAANGTGKVPSKKGAAPMLRDDEPRPGSAGRRQLSAQVYRLERHRRRSLFAGLRCLLRLRRPR